jgi:hypothetical protein
MYASISCFCMSKTSEWKDEQGRFDEALRRLLNTPPDHKPRTKSGAPKKPPREKRAVK